MSFHAPCDLCGGLVNLWFAKLASWHYKQFGEISHYYPRMCIETLRARVKELETELAARESQGGK